MANMLTTKEATLISDLMIYEQMTAKKARLYARVITEPTLAEYFNKIADRGLQRFNTLYAMLGE